MAKNIKYIPQKGFAYEKEKDMAKLQSLAMDGWLLTGMAFGGFAYRLEKGEPQNISYCFEECLLKQSELADYEEIFAAGGWELVWALKEGKRIYGAIFKAPMGTVPVHTDLGSQSENYGVVKKEFFKNFWIMAVLTIGLSILADVLAGMNVPGFVPIIFDVLGVISLMVTGILLLVTVAYWEREKKGKPSIWVYLMMIVVLLAMGAVFGFFM